MDDDKDGDSCNDDGNNNINNCCEMYMKFILYCGCRWKWRMIIAVNLSNWKEEAWSQQIDLAPNMWLHSSVNEHCTSIAEVTGSNPVEDPDILEASSFQKFTAMITPHFE